MKFDNWEKKFMKTHYWDWLINRMKKEYSPITLVTGYMGTGKSSFVLHVCNLLTKYMYKNRFDFERFMFYNFDSFWDTVEDAKKIPMVIEEAGFNLNVMEWRGDFNIAMDKVFQTQRVKGIAWFICVPDVMDITKKHRRKLKMGIEMKSKGYGKVYYISRWTMDMNKTKFWMSEVESIKMDEIFLEEKYYEKWKKYDYEEKHKLLIRARKDVEGDQIESVTPTDLK